MAAHVASFNAVEVPGPWNTHGDRGELGAWQCCRWLPASCKMMQILATLSLTDCTWGQSAGSLRSLCFLQRCPLLVYCSPTGQLPKPCPVRGLQLRKLH